MPLRVPSVTLDYDAVWKRPAGQADEYLQGGGAGALLNGEGKTTAEARGIAQEDGQAEWEMRDGAEPEEGEPSESAVGMSRDHFQDKAVLPPDISEASPAGPALPSQEFAQDSDSGKERGGGSSCDNDTGEVIGRIAASRQEFHHGRQIMPLRPVGLLSVGEAQTASCTSTDLHSSLWTSGSCGSRKLSVSWLTSKGGPAEIPTPGHLPLGPSPPYHHVFTRMLFLLRHI